MEKANEIAFIIHRLVKALREEGQQNEGEIESLVKGASAATAHLVAAMRAKSDIHSRTFQKFLEGNIPSIINWKCSFESSEWSSARCTC